MIIDNDLLSIQHARILAENAFEAHKKLATFSQEQLDLIVTAVCQALEPHLQNLALSSHEETDAGKWSDKLCKTRFVCSQVQEQLRGMRCVGIIGKDEQAGIMEIGVPVGVIVALPPITSPVSTSIYKTLLAIKSGNCILFSPHPGAKKTIIDTLDIMIKVAEENGLPQGCLAYLDPVSKSGSEALMNHPATSMVLATGVPGMLELARKSGKILLYGSTGNGPAFIEKTANIEKAAKDIIASKTFDLGLAPSAEQSIVVDASIVDAVRHSLKVHGAYFMSPGECERLADVLFCPLGTLRKGAIGQAVEVLAQRAGFTVPKETTLLIAEREFVSEVDPYFREILSPVLGFYVEDDWMNACEKCIELLLFERNSHTMVIHSNDDEVIEQFALKKPVGRMLVNTPASLGGLGMTTNLFPAMTLGSRSAGQGVTTDNISPMNLIYKRKVGFGVKKREQVDAGGDGNLSGSLQPVQEDKTAAIQHILAEAIKALT